MGLVVPKMNEVRVGLIGVGERGTGYVDHFNKIEGARITAICDPDSLVLDRARKKMAEYGNTTAAYYGNGDYAYRELLNRQDVDIVVIATPWKWHHPMAKDAMLAGKHAFVEVPLALTIEEMWDLVDTAERTQRNCMMLENVCYRRDVMAALNMVRQGVFRAAMSAKQANRHRM